MGAHQSGVDWREHAVELGASPDVESALGVSTTLVGSMAALFVTGAADMISVVIRSTLVQLETPDAMRGRVSAVNSVFIGASNQLGEFESGATAAALGPVGSVLLGGLGTLAVAGLWTWLVPALARRDGLLPAGTGEPRARARARNQGPAGSGGA
jgi:hypothetical protein